MNCIWVQDFSLDPNCHNEAYNNVTNKAIRFESS